MKNFALLFLTCFLFLALDNNAHGKKDFNIEWEEFEKQVKTEGMSFEEKCQARWNFLWPKAKDGNLEARAGLVYFLLPVMHMDSMSMPGRSGNILSQKRDGAIMAIYSLGADFKDEHFDENYKEYLSSLGSVLFSAVYEQDLYECMRRNPSLQCKDIAIEDNIVPPFNEYAAEIEALIAQGFKPKCYSGASANEHKYSSYDKI